MSNPYVRSLYINCQEVTDVTSAALAFSISIKAGATVIESPAQTGFVDFVFWQPSGEAIANGHCLPLDAWYMNGSDLYLRRPASVNMNLIYGECADPSFIIPHGCLGLIIENPNAGDIYVRKGFPNGYGYTIAIPGDSNSGGAEGITIPGGGSYIGQYGQIAAGDQWHILGSTSGQTAVVNFT